MIGTGVFTSLGFQLVDIKSVFALLLLWIIGGALAFCGAVSYSELGTALPRSGGEYHILSKTIHPSVGFSAGIVSVTIGFVAPSVLAAMALGSYFSSIVSSISEFWVAFFVITFLHLLHVYKLNWGLYFQNYTTLLKVILILLFILFGLTHQPVHNIRILPEHKDLSVIFSAQYAIALIWVSYAYTGWNSVIYISGELKNLETDISKTMLFSTGLVTILYVLLNFVFLYSTPNELMIGQIDIGYIAGQSLFGKNGSKLVAFGISIILLSTVSSYIYIGPRVIQIMSEDHKALSFLRTNKSKTIPKSSFIAQLLISYIFLLTSTFEQVLMYAGVALTITSSLTVLSLFVLRFRKPELNRPYEAWGYPTTPMLYLFSNIWIMYHMFSGSTFESIVGLSIVLFGIFFYFFLSE
tara:strand:+ start:155 stop:1384 length:1230 start_codon:yes stop_codon:yes gene_type:complete